MTLFISNAAAIVLADAFVDRCDAGAGAATLVIYEDDNTPNPPTNADEALNGATTLATLTFSDPAFGGASDTTDEATATASAITDDSSADATGTASFFRVFDSNSLILMQGACGTSGQELNLNTLAIVTAATVSITSMTVAMPES